jgi:class 3 adenylate cyclase
VNLAARIEQATKQFQASLLISDAVQEKLDRTKYPVEDLGPVELKGQSKPTRLFRLT